MMKNIQDWKNNLRMTRKQDKLEKTTVVHQTDDIEHLKRKKQQKQTEAMNQTTMSLLAHLEADAHHFTKKIANCQHLNINKLKEKGGQRPTLHHFPSTECGNPQDFLKIHSPETAVGTETTSEPTIQKNQVTKQTLASVFIQKKTRKVGNADNSIMKSTTCLLAATGTPESVCSWSKALFNDDKEQRRAFEVLVGKFVLTHVHEADQNDDGCFLRATQRQTYQKCKHMLSLLVGQPAQQQSLILFLTGPGGSGKSEIITQVLSYAKEFCMHIQQPFTRNTTLVTASTGVAATLIRGQTVHRACHLNCNFRNIPEEVIDVYSTEVHLVVVDEVSMFNEDDLSNLNVTLNHLTQCPSGVFGNLDIAFMGDFRQLPPVGADPLRKSNTSPFQLLVNCFIELKGMHRFQDDPDCGALCQRFRDGIPRIPEDFNILNDRAITKNNPITMENTRVACTTNKHREAVNTGTWLRHLETHGDSQGFATLADKVALHSSGGKKTHLEDCTKLWTEVGEDDCMGCNNQRFTPMLKIYPNGPVMHTQNSDVENCLANGTQGIITSVHLQPSQAPHTRTINGHTVQCIYASQIHYVTISSNEVSLEIKPKTFSNVNITCPLPEELITDISDSADVQITATQIPLVSNNATTGHKLQGSTLCNIYIPTWSHQTNWPCVMLSRVKTLNGLFLGEKLNPFKDHSVPEELIKMLRFFRKCKSSETFDCSLLE